MLERHSHGIILGAVRSVHFGTTGEHAALIYGHGHFGSLKL